MHRGQVRGCYTGGQLEDESQRSEEVLNDKGRLGMHQKNVHCNNQDAW